MSLELLAQSELVALGPLRRDLLTLYLRWDNDPGVMRGYGRTTEVCLDERSAGLEAQLAGDHLHRTIYDVRGGRPAPIGTVTLAIDHDMHTAELSIALGPEGRGQGLAAPAVRLAARHGFDTANLRSIWLTVLASNTHAIRAYERAGFRHVGRRREAGYWDGLPCDELLMDALPPDIL
ncbi:GNAT family N-acetyltransferase [Streptomyces marincola]|uniref:GNAT family N-acetyltransferase n=1 Tax=Streptomyces marincola TaxID=2878388 RepID=UPI001CF30F7F|nr:GNAT family protein [Streptomyces marincola]UCM87524.1 GNAT family N-acetyltransferase [Streptomyces marincola]